MYLPPLARNQPDGLFCQPDEYTTWHRDSEAQLLGNAWDDILMHLIFGRPYVMDMSRVSSSDNTSASQAARKLNVYEIYLHYL